MGLMTAASRVMRLETVGFVELASLGTSAVAVRTHSSISLA